MLRNQYGLVQRVSVRRSLDESNRAGRCRVCRTALQGRDQLTGYARRGMIGSILGRGFDSRRLHFYRDLQKRSTIRTLWPQNLCNPVRLQELNRIGRCKTHTNLQQFLIAQRHHSVPAGGPGQERSEAGASHRDIKNQ